MYKLIAFLFIFLGAVLYNNVTWAQAPRFRYYQQERLSPTFSLGFEYHTSLFEKSTSYNYAKGLSAQFELPFSRYNDNVGQYFSWVGGVGILKRDEVADGDDPAKRFIQANLAMRLGKYFWNRQGGVGVRPYINAGFNYRSEADTFEPTNKAAFRAGAGFDMMLSGEYLGSYFFRNFDIAIVNSIYFDTRKGHNKNDQSITPTTIEAGFKVIYRLK